MSAHVITTRPVPITAHGAWARLSAAFTAQIEHLAGRDDLTVTCAPGAGRGSPGCFIPALATVELDGTHLGQDPTTCDPSRPSDWDRYPTLCGVFIHEAAHARHSLWTTSTGARAAACTQAAITLEESRIEARTLRKRPAHRRWLRAAARQLVLADFGADASGTPIAPTTPWHAAQAAALLLARVDAGILDADETATLATAVTSTLGPSRLNALAALWHLAHDTADDDAETMYELGRRWCAILGTAPDAPPPAPDQHEARAGQLSPLAAAITATLTAVTVTDAPPAAGTSKARLREDERATRQRATRTARRVFTDADRPYKDAGRTAITGTRPPTPAEQAAARRLARMLRAAGHRERVTTVTTSATPPGRLRMRGALAADAQRAAGAIPTAEPFTRTTRRHVPTPPLRLGIACDVSGSMHAFAAPIASAAWILARAAAHVPDARSATVIFGARVRPITHPGRPPRHVQEFAARDGIEKFRDAVDALDAALDLHQPGNARLLIIVSDGLFHPDERVGGQQQIARLVASGCAVLWIALDDETHRMDGSHLLRLGDPTDAAAAIGQAAIRALRMP